MRRAASKQLRVRRIERGQDAQLLHHVVVRHLVEAEVGRFRERALRVGAQEGARHGSSIDVWERDVASAGWRAPRGVWLCAGEATVRVYDAGPVAACVGSFGIVACLYAWDFLAVPVPLESDVVSVHVGWVMGHLSVVS